MEMGFEDREEVVDQVNQMAYPGTHAAHMLSASGIEECPLSLTFHFALFKH